MPKKGTIFDLFIIIFLMVSLSFTIVLGYHFVDKLSEQPILQQYVEQNRTTSAGKTALSVFNYGYVVVLGVLVISMIILASMLPTHPIFYIPFFMVLVIAIFFAGQFSNIYNEMASQAEFASMVQTQFNIMNYIMRNLPFFIAIFGFTVMVVMYGVVRHLGTTTGGE